MVVLSFFGDYVPFVGFDLGSSRLFFGFGFVMDLSK